MTDDGRLLEQWKRQGSQAAFSALVTRHLNFVYSVCLRETQDAALAEDVTQVVFLLLSRKAPAFGPDTRLTGWLFQTARFACKNARRRDVSRRRREQKIEEQKAGEQMLTEALGQDALWEQVAPRLNAALASLGTKDREAVLLRFADGLSFAELGTALGTSEDAARMRVSRALTRLRGFFAKQGVSVTALVLTGLLADRTTQAAPVTCTAAVCDMASLRPQIETQFQGVLHTMKLTKVTAAIAASFALGAAGLTLNATHHASAQALTTEQIDHDTQSINDPLSPNPAVRAAAQTRRTERTMFLRDRWQPWAQRHQAILRQMLTAKASDTQAVVAVWQALPSRPDHASQSNIAGISGDDLQTAGGLFTWDPAGKNVLKGAVTVPPNMSEHYAKSEVWFNQRLRDDWKKYHDIRLSESMNTGMSHSVLWVSGRVTTMTDTSQFVGHGLPSKDGEECQENAPVYNFLR